MMGAVQDLVTSAAELADNRRAAELFVLAVSIAPSFLASGGADVTPTQVLTPATQVALGPKAPAGGKDST